MITELKRKTIQVTLNVTTGVSNFDICDTIDTILLGSLLVTTEFAIDILETKVIKDQPATYEEKSSNASASI